MGGHFSSFTFPKHIRKSALSSNLPGILVLESPFTDVNDQCLPGVFQDNEATRALSIFLILAGVITGWNLRSGNNYFRRLIINFVTTDKESKPNYL